MITQTFKTVRTTPEHAMGCHKFRGRRRRVAVVQTARPQRAQRVNKLS